MRTLTTAMVMAFLLLPSAFVSAADEWLACGKSSPCVVSVDECDKPVAINRKFVKENEGRNLVSQCGSEYQGPAKETFRAVCKNGKCALEKK